MSGARERLAEYLEHHRGSADTSDELADALLPVVQALVAEGQAEALEAGGGGSARPRPRHVRPLAPSPRRRPPRNHQREGDV